MPKVKNEQMKIKAASLSIGTLGAAVALSFALPVSAASMTASASDSAFVKTAAMGGMAEVAAGTLAEQRSTNPKVRAFAMKMVADHTKANAKLAALAKSKGIMLPSSIGPANMKMKAALEGLHGTAFDTAYLQGQKTGHSDMEALMKSEIANGKDAGLVAFAKATLPTVEEHLALDEKDLASMSSSMSGMKMK